MKQENLHEDLRREEEVKGSSNRGFGQVFAAFCAIVAAFKGWHESIWALAWLAAAIGFLAAAYLAPALLAPLNRLWTKFGLLLFRIINPVVMFLVYLICIVPMGVVMRLFGWDPMRRRFDPEAGSYWIPRDPPGPPADSMKNQF
ncbi:SxtJ family membrane protein [Marinibaculum pumilum]|uniref:SxtJ family membrane protein n=1 Tax=Marinibaculum pumilum TaxID=1766165 RepID=A0ABV7L749_9PROT